MTHRYADISFTDDVKSAQDQYGSLEQNQRLQDKFGPNDTLGAREVAFIEQCDTFFLATVSQTGWPYVQHRGGPPGFLRVLTPKQIAYPDFRGNTQLISVGNTIGNNRCSILMLDQARRKRLKILAYLQVEDIREDAREMLSQSRLPGYKAKIERMVFIDVVAFDWNCPQHITQRYTLAEAAVLLNENHTQDHKPHSTQGV